MKITDPRPTRAAGAVGRAAKRGGEGFTLSESGGSPEARSAAGLTGPASVGSLDALMALQAAPDSLDPRRRAAARATDILDALDQVKIALLDGAPVAASLARLKQSADRLREQSDDAGLERIIDEVEVRAAVELAKHRAA